MRKLFVLLIALVIASPVFAQTVRSTFGNFDSSGEYTMTLSSVERPLFIQER